MYDMKALYEAKASRTPSPFAWSIPRRRSSPAAATCSCRCARANAPERSSSPYTASTSWRGVTIDEEENIRIGSLTSFSHITRRPHHPEVHQCPRRGGGHGRRPADPKHRHHRRQHLQRRYLRGFRLHAPRVGGHRGAHGQATATAACPSSEFYIKAGTGRHPRSRMARSRPPSSSPRPAMRTAPGHYIKYAMSNAMDIATLGCSVNVRLFAGQADHRARPHRLRRGRPGAPCAARPRQPPTVSP